MDPRAVVGVVPTQRLVGLVQADPGPLAIPHQKAHPVGGLGAVSDVPVLPWPVATAAVEPVEDVVGVAIGVEPLLHELPVPQVVEQAGVVGRRAMDGAAVVAGKPVVLLAPEIGGPEPLVGALNGVVEPPVEAVQVEMHEDAARPVPRHQDL